MPGDKAPKEEDLAPDLQGAQHNLEKRFEDICLGDVNIIFGDQVVGDVLNVRCCLLDTLRDCLDLTPGQSRWILPD